MAIKNLNFSFWLYMAIKSKTLTLMLQRELWTGARA
jgi:hypothetical protein